jgi:hypothetical protein
MNFEGTDPFVIRKVQISIRIMYITPTDKPSISLEFLQKTQKSVPATEFELGWMLSSNSSTAIDNLSGKAFVRLQTGFRLGSCSLELPTPRFLRLNACWDEFTIGGWVNSSRHFVVSFSRETSNVLITHCHSA